MILATSQDEEDEEEFSPEVVAYLSRAKIAEQKRLEAPKRLLRQVNRVRSSSSSSSSPFASEDEWLPPRPSSIPSSAGLASSPIDDDILERFSSRPLAPIAKRARQVSLFTFGYTKEVTINKKKIKITKADMNDDSSAKGTPRTLKRSTVACSSCGLSCLGQRGLDIHTMMSKSCKAVHKMKRAESEAVFLGDVEARVSAKKARKMVATEGVLSSLQARLMLLARQRVRLHMMSTSAWLTTSPDGNDKIDARKANRGVAVRKQYPFASRMAYIEDCEAFLGRNEGSVSDWVRERKLPITFNKYMSKGVAGWRHPTTRAHIVGKCATLLKRAIRPGTSKPKFPLAENELYKEAKAKRANGRKVSARCAFALPPLACCRARTVTL